MEINHPTNFFETILRMNESKGNTPQLISDIKKLSDDSFRYKIDNFIQNSESSPIDLLIIFLQNKRNDDISRNTNFQNLLHIHEALLCNLFFDFSLFEKLKRLDFDQLINEKKIPRRDIYNTIDECLQKLQLRDDRDAIDKHIACVMTDLSSFPTIFSSYLPRIILFCTSPEDIASPKIISEKMVELPKLQAVFTISPTPIDISMFDGLKNRQIPFVPFEKREKLILLLSYYLMISVRKVNSLYFKGENKDFSMPWEMKDYIPHIKSFLEIIKANEKMCTEMPDNDALLNLRIFTMSKDRISKFTSRYEALRHLSSQNVHLSKLIDCMTSNHNRVVLVSEGWNSSLLSEREKLRTGVISLRIVIKQILNGLLFLHENSLAHRGLNPSNILLNEDGDVKLCDWELFDLTSSFDSNEFYSDPFYTAPEVYSQYDDEFLLNRKADVWSLGICILHLLHGFKPLSAIPPSDNNEIISLVDEIEYIKSNEKHALKALSLEDALNQLDSKNTEIKDLLKGASDLARITHHFISPFVKSHSFFCHSCRMPLFNTHPSDSIPMTTLCARCWISTFCPEAYLLRNGEKKLDTTENDRRNFISQCLSNPADRPSVNELLLHDFLIPSTINIVKGKKEKHYLFSKGFRIKPEVSLISSLHFPHFPDLGPILKDSGNPDSYIGLEDWVKEKYVSFKWKHWSFDEIFYLWKWNIGENHCLEYNDEELHKEIDRIHSFTPAILRCPYSLSYQEKKNDIQPLCYSLISLSKLKSNIASEMTNDNIEFKKALLLLEQFKELLEYYPSTNNEIIQLLLKNNVNLPPFLRTKIWPCLLNITCDTSIYDSLALHRAVINSFIDSKLSVDIVRCFHSYSLLSSEAAHKKFYNLIKSLLGLIHSTYTNTWIGYYPQYKYWQGLNYICAPILSLFFYNEPLAFVCLDVIVNRYLHPFITTDQTDFLHNYLDLFCQITAYHDPQLAHHLSVLDLSPEIYCFPWFSTLFVRLFSLEGIYSLWEVMFLNSSPSYPIFISVAILLLSKSRLLNCKSYNDAVTFFSNVSFVDVTKVITLSQSLFNDTIPSLFNLSIKRARYDKSLSRMLMVPNISIEDFVKYQKDLAIIDIRSLEEYSAFHFHSSIHLPFKSRNDKVSPEDVVRLQKLATTRVIIPHDVTKIAHINNIFASQILSANCSHLCMLTGGMKAVKEYSKNHSIPDLIVT